MMQTVRITWLKNRAEITVASDDTATDVVLMGLNATNGRYKATMGLKVRPARFVDPSTTVAEMSLQRGLAIWHADQPQFMTNAEVWMIKVHEGSWKAKPKCITALRSYTIAKALRIGGIDFGGKAIFSDGHVVNYDAPVTGLTAVLVRKCRVISPTDSDNLANFSVSWDGKTENLAVSERYSVVDIPRMLGVPDPADKVCVCNKETIQNDFTSVALYEGEMIEIMSMSML